MIDAARRPVLHELRAHLRPFVARRVPEADVDDVVQDAMLRMHRGLGGLRADERFGPWIYAVARSAIADHRRALRRRPSAGGGVQVDEPADDPGDDAEGGAPATLLAEAIAPMVAMLPSPYREALTLTELEGLSQAEAAAMLGVPASTLKSRVQRGRARLRDLVEQCCEVALDARGKVIDCAPRTIAAGPASDGDGPRPAGDAAQTCRCTAPVVPA